VIKCGQWGRLIISELIILKGGAIMNKGRMIMAILVGLFVVSLAVTVAAEKFPSKPITVIMPFSAGGSSDLTMRILANIVTEPLGQPIIVTNKTGGSGAVAYGILKNEKPDGYTIGVVSWSGSAIAPHIRKVPYDTKRDFDFVLQLTEYFNGLAVRADAPWNTFKDFLEYAKKNPGKATYSTPGAASSNFLALEMIARQENVKFTHVPFKGGAPAAAALLGGHVKAAACNEVSEFAKAGKMKLLVQFGEKKSKNFPDVPTIKDLGYKSTLQFYLGVWGPKGIPPERLNILEKTFKKGMEEKSFIKILDRFNLLPLYRNGKDFESLVFESYDAMGKLTRELGLAK
jgi:tripartite-type tricarboxylate transporter receptor subunit TctC